MYIQYIQGLGQSRLSIADVSLELLGTDHHREHRFQQYLHCCASIVCYGDVFVGYFYLVTDLVHLLISLSLHSKAVAQAVSRWLPTAAARVRVRAACGVCGGQSVTGAGFFRVLRFPLPIIPPISPSS
jgi:hypothetical protein